MKKLKLNKEFEFKLILALAFLTLLVIGPLYLFSRSYLDRVIYGQSNFQHQAKRQIVDDSDPLITKVPSQERKITSPLITAADPSISSAQAKVNIVEYSDFTCSFCYEQEKVINKVLSEYKDKVRLVWKDFPDNDVNSVSFQAAIAARCAQLEGKFWEYHNELFKSQKIDYSLLVKIASQIGLNEADFANCLVGQDTKELIDNNIKEGNNLMITGVPYFFVNQQKIMGDIRYEDLKRMVEAELNGNK